MKIMVSACLLGENCKYDGGNNRNEMLLRKLAGHEIIPVCPEVAGGLPVPRIPVEILNGKAVNREGLNVDSAFRLGAEKALEITQREKPDLVILQSRSPSCGVNEIYDGTFSGKRIPGHGIFAGMAIDAGFRVVDVENLDTVFPEDTPAGNPVSAAPSRHQEQLRQLFLEQKHTLDLFLERGAISRAQYDKSLGDLAGKMGIKDDTES